MPHWLLIKGYAINCAVCSCCFCCQSCDAPCFALPASTYAFFATPAAASAALWCGAAGCRHYDAPCSALPAFTYLHLLPLLNSCLLLRLLPCGVVPCSVCLVVWCLVVWCGACLHLPLPATHARLMSAAASAALWCGVVWCGVVWCFRELPARIGHEPAQCLAVHGSLIGWFLFL
jgi:hypothetical protein